jgi:hypothetical protein
MVNMRLEYVDCWFPELHKVGHFDIPRQEVEQLDLLPDLIGKTIVTVSETIILMFLREVRLGRMAAEDLKLYCGNRRIELAEDGSLLDWWDGGFFETGFNLRFN